METTPTTTVTDNSYIPKYDERLKRCKYIFSLKLKTKMHERRETRLSRMEFPSKQHENPGEI